MYIVKTYLRAENADPREPTDTLIIMILINMSEACTFTLAVAFFFNPKNRFQGPLTSLIPKVEFKSGKDWIFTNIFLCFGTITVVMMYYADLNNAFFNYYGIKNFTWDEKVNISTATLVTYHVGVECLFWALEGGVVLCCVFYAMTRDIVRHVEFTQRLILESVWDLRTAKRRYRCLLEYTEKSTSSLKVWFIIHLSLFVLIVLALVIEWIQVTSSPSQHHLKEILLAQTAGSFLIAFKFSFPIFASSRVTSRFDKMFALLNQRFNAVDYQHCDTFLTYCKKCKAGFKIFGVRITGSVALVSLLSSLVGFLRLYKQLDGATQLTTGAQNVMYG